MGWYYKPPTAFPASFLSCLREGLAYPEDFVILGSSPKRKDMLILAESFRWFKWCIKQQPGEARDLFQIISLYDVRSSIIEDEVGYILSLTVRPTKLSEFQRLNSALFEELERSDVV